MWFWKKRGETNTDLWTQKWNRDGFVEEKVKKQNKKKTSCSSFFHCRSTAVCDFFLLARHSQRTLAHVGGDLSERLC